MGGDQGVAGKENGIGNHLEGLPQKDSERSVGEAKTFLGQKLWLNKLPRRIFDPLKTKKEP